MLQMLQMIFVVLLLILMLLVAMVAKEVMKPERRSLPELAEDRKIEKERRAEKRAQDKEALANETLMRKVDEYDGNIR